MPAPSTLPAPAGSAPAKRVAEAPRKEMISIRLDADLLAFLRATGPGWQSRVNDLLRRHIERAAKKR